MGTIEAYIELTGRDGQPCHIWRNPTEIVYGMRGLMTQSDLYVWQADLPHADVEHDTGIDGVHIALRDHVVLANNETVALPEHFPWLFPDREQAEAMDIEDRRTVVTDHLLARLKAAYPTGFTVLWYC